MKRYLVLLILTVTVFVAIDAQETIFRNYSSLQYQGGTQNWDMEQLPDGRIAVANNTGLLIYDGAKWSLFPIRNYSVVRALYYDAPTGRLYAGASGEFGYYLVDPKTYQFVYHSLSDLLPVQQRNFGEIWKIVPWRGQLVFQSKSHLFIYNKQEKVTTFHPKDRIETIVGIGQRLIVAFRHGLAEYSAGHCHILSNASFNSDMVVRSILSYGRFILLATQQDGIMIYDGNRLIPDNSDISSILKASQIFCAKLSGTKLAVGTVRNGLLLRDLQNGSTQYINLSKGLLNNTVLSAMFDRNGNIWLGLDNGLSCAMPNVPFRNVVSERFNIGTGYASVIQGNKMYLGTNQGLYALDMPFVQRLVYQEPRSVNGISGQIWNLVTIDGTVYCCADRGLYCIHGPEAQRVAGPNGTWFLYELKKSPGCVLAADYMGFVLLKKERQSLKFSHRITSTTPLEVGGNFMEDADGTIWLGHWRRGIYHLRLSADKQSMQVLQCFDSHNGLLTDDNNQVCRIDGKIYVSSVDGFRTYDRKLGKLVHDTVLNKVFNTYGEALRVTETPAHDLWAQKQDYVAIAHRKGNGYVTDSTSYRGMAKTQQFGLGNICPLGNGMTLINSNDGFYLVRDNFKGKDADYPLFIRRVVSTNNGDSVVFRHTFVKFDEQHIVLPHSLNSIRIEYVQPEYMAENAITYSCFLENYDQRWSQSNSVSKEYTKLAKGDYTFRVKAYNRISGKTQETAITITILPAWYETIWAYIVYFLLTCAAFYAVVRFLKLRAERQLTIERTKRKAEMTQMQNEQLQSELKHKSGELASSTMNSIHQNDIFQKLDEDMAMLSESVRREDKKAVLTSKINEIRNNLQTYLNDDEGWERFEENFNIVYDDFMKKLTEQYSNLKTSDRKLCAYLRMGLSSKEMASLLNMSVRSIETARYRLRKKLNLESGENLTDFIQNFNKGVTADKQE